MDKDREPAPASPDPAPDSPPIPYPTSARRLTPDRVRREGTMPDKSVRLGFVGAGGRTARELLDLVQIEGAEIAAIGSRDPKCLT